jgi:hypothetical protein
MASITVSSAAGRRVASEMQRLRARAKSLREQSNEQTEIVMRTATVGGSAFGLAWVNGRYGEDAEIFGIPPAVAAAVGAHVAGFAGWGDPKLMHAVGDGGLAV